MNYFSFLEPRAGSRTKKRREVLDLESLKEPPCTVAATRHLTPISTTVYNSLDGLHIAIHTYSKLQILINC